MYGGVQEYNPVEYKAKLDRVFNRHPNINVEPMMHNERLGFQPHEKKELEREIEQGRRPHEVIFTMCICIGSCNFDILLFAELFENHSSQRTKPCPRIAQSYSQP